MALVTFQSGVLAFQHIAGLFMIESPGIPLDEREIAAVVFGVAASALLAGAGRDVVARMQPLVSLQAAGDFRVAVQALEGCLAAELVTVHAVGWSVQRMMRPR